MSQEGVFRRRANGPRHASVQGVLWRQGVSQEGVAQCKACYGDKVCLKQACIERRANGPRCAPVHGVIGDQARFGKACTQK